MGLRFLMFPLTLYMDVSTLFRHAHVRVSHGQGIEFGSQGLVLKLMAAYFEIGLFSARAISFKTQSFKTRSGAG